MGKVRVQKYGAEIIEVIQNYISEHNLEPKEIVFTEIEKKPKKPKINTKLASLELFKEGKSILDIAKERDLTTGTITNHLASFIDTGEVKITDLIPKDKYEELKKIMKTT